MRGCTTDHCSGRYVFSSVTSSNNGTGSQCEEAPTASKKQETLDVERAFLPSRIHRPFIQEGDEETARRTIAAARSSHWRRK
ncbi:hypothetical protein KPH14_011713 [Odynerus spinipes]|uniref:Uncharacterized protein n=1 Tax=Odynerus spinipes TaxID=1348599 RepID=A0AAD9VUM4_9HYME|nr:hypothetical protein KPH14_011713 [Odynerus spinipes]